MKILGVDSSTNLGLCLLDTDTGRTDSRLIQHPGTKGHSRAQLIAHTFDNALTEWSPELAVLEGFAYGNANSLALLVEVATLLKNAMYARRIGWYEVSPNALKKWTVGKGNASKKDMAAAVSTRWGYQPSAKKGDDLVDAYALARVGAFIHGGGEGVAFQYHVPHP